MAPVWRLLSLLLVLCALGTAHAATYTFNTDKIDNCTRQGKEYSCTKLPLANEYDRIVIASGVTVTVSSDVWFGYNQALSMSGTARLVTSGNLSIADVAPSNLAITGGSFASAKTFTVGNQVHDIKADISAATLMLGSGSGLKITGRVVASGAVQIGSNTTITGAVEGASIAIGTPVKIYGPVTSTGPVQIGSGAIIEGAIGGTVVTAGSPVTIKGNVTATTSFTLDSGSTVTGDVDTGRLTIYASESTITGTAKVDSAVLYWHGKVAKTITCKKGTAPGKCDCVDNQSGWEVNTTDGPRCEAAKPAAGPLDHFLITHDGNGSVCAPEAVTVTACADANCSSNYTGNATGRLAPGGVDFNTGNSGSVRTSVASTTVGTEALRLTASGTTPVRCYNSATKSSSCNMEFASAGFQIDIPQPVKAGESVVAKITALEKNPNNDSCVAKFKNVQNIEYSCGYLRPGTGAESLGLSTSSSVALACTPGTTRTLATNFGTTGTAEVTLNYEDAGELSLKAKSGDIEGGTSLVVFPYKFGFALPAMPLRAGDDVALTVTSQSKSGKTTRNFDKDGLPAMSTSTKLSIVCASPANARLGTLAGDPFEFKQGQATTTLSWNEVGKMDLLASVQNEFLGSGMKFTGSSAGNAPCVSIGPFIPKYFLVEQVNPLRQPLDFFYAGEPIPVRVKAMGAKGEVTENFANTIASEAVTLLAFDKDGKLANPNGGVLSAGAIGADKFVKGVAPANPVYASPAAAAPAKRSVLAPGIVRLRAQNAAATVSSSASDTYEKAVPTIRSGRLRIATLFGRAGSTLKLPVTAEYWSGNSWLLNNKDNVTIIAANAMAHSRFAHANGNGVQPKLQVFPALALKDGKAELPVQGDTAGWIDIAFNLGAGTAADQSCLAAHPPSVGAARPWLQAFGNCTDPSGRATFGIYAPESRRIIHVREVFN